MSLRFKIKKKKKMHKSPTLIKQKSELFTNLRTQRSLLNLPDIHFDQTIKLKIFFKGFNQTIKEIVIEVPLVTTI